MELNNHDPNAELQYDQRVIETLVLTKAIEYLENFVLESMKDDIKEIATDAVKQWIKVRTSINSPSGVDPLALNYNIQFIEQVVHKMNSEIQITVKEHK